MFQLTKRNGTKSSIHPASQQNSPISPTSAKDPIPRQAAPELEKANFVSEIVVSPDNQGSQEVRPILKNVDVNSNNSSPRNVRFEIDESFCSVTGDETASEESVEKNGTVGCLFFFELTFSIHLSCCEKFICS